MAASNLELGNRQAPVQANGVNNLQNGNNGQMPPPPPNGPHNFNGNGMPNGGMLANMPVPAGQALDYAVIHEMINELASLSAMNRDEGRRVAERVHSIQEQNNFLEDDPLASLGPEASTIASQDQISIINAQRHMLEASRTQISSMSQDMLKYERLLQHWESTSEQMLARMREYGGQVHASQMEWQKYWTAAWNRSRDETIQCRTRLDEVTDHARLLGTHVRSMAAASAEERQRILARARDREEGLQRRVLELQEELLECGRHDLVGEEFEGRGGREQEIRRQGGEDEESGQTAEGAVEEGKEDMDTTTAIEHKGVEDMLEHQEPKEKVEDVIEESADTEHSTTTDISSSTTTPDLLGEDESIKHPKLPIRTAKPEASQRPTTEQLVDLLGD